MISVLTGLAAGSLHVVTGPDHLAALAPIAVDDPQRAVRMGALWGLGHGLGVLGLGALGVWVSGWFEIEVLSSWSEVVVGLLLIGLGLWSIRVARRVTIHSHGHAHEAADEHAHLHVHLDGTRHTPASHGLHSHAAFGVGMLHGVAGAGHIFGVLPSLALPPEQAAIYLLAYCLAAVISMGAVGLGLGRLVAGQSTRFIRRIMWGCGLMALAVGGVWLSQGLPPS